MRKPLSFRFHPFFNFFSFPSNLVMRYSTQSWGVPNVAEHTAANI
jgi:hypothetical protein